MATNLHPAIPRDRASIMRRMTRYAIECVIDGHATVIGFTARPSRRALLEAARAQSDAILPFVTETDTCAYQNRVLTLGARVVLRFGETERRS